MQGDTTPARDKWLTALAVLMGLMAVSNFTKPLTQSFDPGESAGFVFFGTRLHGAVNAIIGPLFGAALAAYAYGVWTLKRWVVPLASTYAIYVILNLIFFMVNEPAAEQPPLIGMLGYAAVAIGVSGGGALYLRRQRERLR